MMAQLVIVDLRNIYRTDEMERAAFRYVAVGRAGVEQPSFDRRGGYQADSAAQLSLIGAALPF